MSQYKGYGNSVSIEGNDIFVKSMLLKENFTFDDIMDISFTEPTLSKNGCLIIQTSKNTFKLYFLKKHAEAYTELYKTLESNFKGRPDSELVEQDNVAKCPKCGSTSIELQSKKLSLGRAVAGNVIAGPLGGAIGAVTSKKNYCVCLNCGHKWKI